MGVRNSDTSTELSPLLVSSDSQSFLGVRSRRRPASTPDGAVPSYSSTCMAETITVEGTSGEHCERTVEDALEDVGSVT